MAAVGQSFAILFALCTAVNGFSYELSLFIGPGEVECFYQHVHVTNVYLEIDYQVIDGASLDINFSARSPGGEMLRADQRKKGYSHQLLIKETGDYELCFDNKFSTMTHKLVFFEVYSDFDDVTFVNSEQQGRIDAANQKSEEADALMEVTSERLKEVIENVRLHVQKSRNIQGVIRSHMRQDRTIAEANYTRVHFFSAVYIFVMISVSLVQVLMIRSLFNSKDTHNLKVST